MCLSVSLPLPKDHWEVTKDKDGIVTYIGLPDGKGLRPTRSVMSVDRPVAEVVKSILDFGSYPNWVPYCSNSSTIDHFADTLIYFYQVLDMPLIKNRDIVIKVAVHENEEGTIGIRMDSAPTHIESKPSALRISKFWGEYSIQTDKVSGLTVVELVNQVDPGGFIPTFAINWASRSQPHETFSNLREQILAYEER